MTRQSFQQGYVSEAIPTRRGVVFKIRYRVRTAAGKCKQKCETLYGLTGKKAARAVLAKRIQDATTMKPEAIDMTLRDFVETYWKPSLDRKGLKLSTRQSYDSALERHILPALGDHRLTDIVPLHVEEFSRSKSACGLKSKTVRNLLLILQAIFSVAVDNDLVIKSPVRKSHKPIYQRKEKPVWSPAQIQSIIESAPPSHRAFLCCAALTGARLGELLGLQWKHIDLPNRKLRIEQSLWHGNLVPPKTGGSIRTIYFGNTLAEALTVLRGAKDHHAEDFVFSGRDGRPLHPDVLRKDMLYPLLDRLRIPRTAGASGFHTFRHSAASILNRETGNLKLAQKLLGHATIDMTADVYTHTSREAEREAALAIERAIYGDLFSIVPNSGNRNNSAVLN